MENQNNTQDLNELRILARDAFENQDFLEARRKYGDILRLLPNDLEANIYKAFFIANRCKTYEIESAANKLYDGMADMLEVIAVNVDNSIDNVFEVSYICILVTTFIANKMGEATSEFETTEDIQKYVSRIYECFFLEYGIGDMIEALGEKYIKYAVDMWEDGVENHNLVFEFFDDKKTNYRTMKEYADKIKKYNPSYKFVKPSSNGGCYVATAVYGSYDCPEVWTLRRYRDNILAKTVYGRIFIRIYYTVSPTFVKCFGKTKWFNRIFKAKLDTMVLNLNRKGVEDTPYKDQIWH